MLPNATKSLLPASSVVPSHFVLRNRANGTVDALRDADPAGDQVCRFAMLHPGAAMLRFIGGMNFQSTSAPVIVMLAGWQVSLFVRPSTVTKVFAVVGRSDRTVCTAYSRDKPSRKQKNRAKRPSKEKKGRQQPEGKRDG